MVNRCYYYEQVLHCYAGSDGVDVGGQAYRAQTTIFSLYCSYQTEPGVNSMGERLPVYYAGSKTSPDQLLPET